MSCIDRKVYFNAAVQTAATNNSEDLTLGGQNVEFIATLVASAVNAATTLDVKIQHSPDGTTWFDLVAFTQFTGGGATSELKQIAVNVLPHTRAVTTLAGVTKAATVTVALHHN